MKAFFASSIFLFLAAFAFAKEDYWNVGLQINTVRPPLPSSLEDVEYLDLNGDGVFDAIKTVSSKGIPMLWLDDGKNGINKGDFALPAVNSCLLVDRNNDGVYDFIVKWLDEDGDMKADLQLVAEYPLEPTDLVWPNGHYMWVIDTQHDGVFNCIDWQNFKINAWKKSGLSNFYLGYGGQKAFLKNHTSTDKMRDLRLNWENPFLFYDEDFDNLSEMAIRVMVPFKKTGKEGAKPNTKEYSQLGGNCDWLSLAVDLDNDNAPGNEFDFDFSICYIGDGFKYTDCVQRIKNLKAMRGMEEADKFFPDPRIRNLQELVYPDHRQVKELMYSKDAKWSKFWFVYDEDDDCSRWERVEFYKPLDVFKVGTNKGGLDDNVQSDPSGDRGEWDLNGDGGGFLYIAKFDGKFHLAGAEWGAWRIDQDAEYFRGFNRTFQNKDPKRFATILYEDSDKNGFFDTVKYDLDGDKVFEETVSLAELGISDICEKIDISKFSYADYLKLGAEMANRMWENAQELLLIAQKSGLDTSWYAKLAAANSIREKYSNGWWLQFYIYRDLRSMLVLKGETEKAEKLKKAYYSGDWSQFGK